MDKENKLIVMVGLPGSGKSTFAEKLEKSRYNYRLVSTDKIRSMFGNEESQENNYQVFDIAYNKIEHYLNLGYNVIFDATNLRLKYRRKLFKRFNEFDQVAVFMNTNIEECKKRNNNRPRHVPLEVIENMEKTMIRPTLEEGYSGIVIIDGENIRNSRYETKGISYTIKRIKKE